MLFTLYVIADAHNGFDKALHIHVLRKERGRVVASVIKILMKRNVIYRVIGNIKSCRFPFAECSHTVV